MSIAALESQLRAQLDDWDHWLVYGDWLSDQGDERGTLVRLEHRMETEALSPEEERALQRQMDRLVLAHGDLWKVPAIEGAELGWQHGFVVRARVASLRGGPYEPLAELLLHPQARLLARLELRYEAMDDEGVEALAACPGLAHVTSLDLRYNGLGDPAARALARSPYTGELAELHLHHNRLTASGVRALAESGLLGHMHTLDLRENPMGPEGARALASATGLAHLDLLHLSFADIGPEGARAMGQCPHPKLRRYWRAR
jgi:uncharacterized protein (TIGR02996 family)